MNKKFLLIIIFNLILPLLVCTKVNASSVNVYCPNTMELYGSSQNISITVEKSNGQKTNNYTKSFSSSNTGIVTVDANGKMTAKGVGKVTININIKYFGQNYNFNKTVTVNRRKLCDLGTVSIKEISSIKGTNPYLKNNGVWCLDFNGYNGISIKSNNSGYMNGAVALYTIQGIRGMSPNKNYLTAGTDPNKTYFQVEKDKAGNITKVLGTNFKIIGYKWAPNYSSYQSFLQAIYDEILAGYPVAIHVYNSIGSDIYVVGYAVNSTKNRTSGKLSAKDIYVIDTSAGQWKKLSDFREYKSNGKYVLGIHDTSTSTTTNTIAITRGTQVVNYAKRYLGYTGSQLGYNSAWCASFATKCYKECGVFSSGSSDCDTLIEIAKKNGCWKSKSSGYKPKAGDLIFYDYQPNGYCDHVDIIESYTSDKNFKIIGGNLGGKVKEYTRLDNGYHNSYIGNHIMGFYSISN